MLKVHDWPEVLAGDRITAVKDDIEKKRLKAEKFIVERESMQTICTPMGEAGQEFYRLWLEYVQGNSDEAEFARQLDKLQSVIKAQEYELSGESVRARDFLESYIEVIKHPALVPIVNKLEIECRK